MPDIAEYYAHYGIKPQVFPRAPVRQLSDTGQGLEAQALSQVGGALTDTSRRLAEYAAEKQLGRDSATLVKLRSEMNDFEFAEETAVENLVFNDLKEFDKLEKSYAERWNKKTQELLKNQNERVKEHFNNYTKLHKNVQ